MLEYATDQNLQELVESKKLAMIDFFATWCGPCRMVGAEIEEIENNAIGLDIIKVDVDECPVASNQYSIEVVPTLLFVKNGKVVERVEGFLRAEQMLQIAGSLK